MNKIAKVLLVAMDFFKSNPKVRPISYQFVRHVLDANQNQVLDAVCLVGAVAVERGYNLAGGITQDTQNEFGLSWGEVYAMECGWDDGPRRTLLDAKRLMTGRPTDAHYLAALKFRHAVDNWRARNAG